VTSIARRVLLSAATVAALGGAMEACLPLPPGGVVVIELRPPAPRHERMGRAPGSGYVWVGGFWVWRAGEFVWAVGQWMPVPPGHRYWVPARWVHTRRGWYFIEGHWD
jgi:hypothetical protein